MSKSDIKIPVTERAMSEWRDLKTDPPQGDRLVILFPCISDVGILYTTSNPDYARLNGTKNGYTHWTYFDPHPMESEAEARCEQIRQMDEERSERCG